MLTVVCCVNYLLPNNGAVVFSLRLSGYLVLALCLSLHLSLVLCHPPPHVCIYRSHSSSAFLYLLLWGFLSVLLSLLKDQNSQLSDWLFRSQRCKDTGAVWESRGSLRIIWGCTMFLFTASCSLEAPLCRDFLFHITVLVWNQRFLSCQSLCPAATSALITCSLLAWFSCLHSSAGHQAPGLLCQISHPNMTGCHSNKTLLRTAPASYIMDGQSTQHLSPSASLLPFFSTWAELDSFCVFQQFTMSHSRRQR